eukprot:6135412-Pyramimonas_sp.AAC.1
MQAPRLGALCHGSHCSHGMRSTAYQIGISLERWAARGWQPPRNASHGLSRSEPQSTHGRMSHR